MSLAEAMLLTVITASTPLLLTAIGELVVERSGVLNLGVEGMMIMGAACGFAAAITSGSTALGVVAGIGAGMAMALAFGVMTLVFAANQVASGLALTILGLGLSGLIGANFVGLRRDPMPKLELPGLTDIPFVGSVLFGQDAFVYASFGLAAGVSWFLWRTRAGLKLRAIGENQTSAHALGHPVIRTRFLAVLFGGGCAGLAGAYLSLAYTPFWVTGMTAGRGWIALALVVFSSWLPLRVVVGAYLFGAVSILQLYAQGGGLELPAAIVSILPVQVAARIAEALETLVSTSQLMSALPYLATIVVLVVISGARARGRAPGSLGIPFVPDR